ncbi:unnamed protein product [Plutella xylostella]|uniref:(diamondback moth) hypothetical protein n=1 Tax=Plutella xylostella TaxID=51655 RepID=A0A8S4DB47_PLUXY|nr:unnamed protein product [Plutella xylostella]
MTSAQREASAVTKFRLLMWKNFLIQWRHPAQTVAELLVPVLAMSLVMVLRSQIMPSMEDRVDYPPFPAHTLQYSSVVLAGMNVTTMSIAYSPTSPVLQDVVQMASLKLLVNNYKVLLPLLIEQLENFIPGFDPGILENLDPTQLPDDVLDLLKILVNSVGYENSAELKGIYRNEESTRTVIAAVEFPDELLGATTIPLNMSYALRFPEKPRLNSFFGQGGRSWRTTLVFPTYPTPGPRFPYSYEGGNDPGYVNEMFIALQQCISMELISRMTGQSLDLDVKIQRFPHPPYTLDGAIQALLLLFPMFFILSFSYTAVNLVRAVTVEKESQLKEAMKIMGLPTWLHWTAWFCKQFLFLLVIAVLIVLLLKINWFTTPEGFSEFAVFTHTPWSVLLFFTLLYLVCVIFLCFMVSSFFAKASTAALFMGVTWFILYIPAVLLSMDESVSLAAQVLACLSVNTAMSYAFQLMITEESNGGLQWGKFFFTPAADEPRLLFGHVVLMIVLDCALYLLVALYCEQVMPGPFGTARPWYFPFTREFWWSDGKASDGVVIVDETQHDVTKEEDPKDYTAGVKISNLTKVYGANVAVNNLSLNIFNDQITVLLGHNGAGKSTTISMLTGNVSATSGSIWLAGYDIAHQLKAARAQVGLCPQHNVLFSELTVREHLEFFGRLKGLIGQGLAEEIESLIEKLEMQEKRDYQSGGLSGGQKRRLCVGIALSGGARVVLLDEPTSGMDPASRRALWHLLQQEKKDRAMILTTHFMDEADYLGDRIAIMSGGKLQCVGSPYFLKKHYGVGYTLVIVKGEAFNKDACTELIKKYIPDVPVGGDKGKEVTYSLSNDHSHIFEDLLTDLENNMESIGFKDYGLSATTIEDVFMSVGSDVVHDGADSDAATATDALSEDTECPGCEGSDCPGCGGSTEYLDGQQQTLSGASLVWQHARAMWLKLWLVWSRSWGLLLLQILIPLVIINATLGILQYMVSLTDNVQERHLTLNQGFLETETYLNYNNVSNITSGAVEAYRDLFNDSTTRLTVVEDDTIPEYYINQSTDALTLSTMRTQVLIGASFDNATATAWFSNFGYHDVAISLATLHKALLKAVLPGAQLNVTNHPLETNYEDTNDLRLIVVLLSMQFSNGLGNSVSIVSAVFIMFYIKERLSRAKLLQKASGLQPVVMWGSAAVFDWLYFMIISLTFIVSCVAFQVTGLSSAIELSRMFLLLVLYGAAVTPMLYLLSYLFSGPAFGFVVLVFTNSLLGLMGAQIVEALYSLDVNEQIPDIMDGILQFFPLYSLVTSVKKVHEISLKEWSCIKGCDFFISAGILTPDQCTPEFLCSFNQTTCCFEQDAYFNYEEPGVLRYILSTLLSCIIFWAMLMFIEYRIYSKIFNRNKVPPPIDPNSQDDDVVEEAKHVDFIGEAGTKQHNLVAKNLSKYYGKNLAVNQVSFSVGEMECFGLLGVNGAGKTTTFKMLMGDETVSSGDAFVRGHSVTKNIKKVHENIGYCPQFDALFEELTGRETLRFYALLRGLKPNTIVALTEYLANSLGFTKHLDKRVYQYSGGNKRKLSTAVALMGYGRCIFLDEPTTGVDPAAKRQVWRAIRKATRSGRSVVLTSHSMEECEALCSRLTVMVNGQFMCLGTPQHLKNKFSEGFTLTIKLNVADDLTNVQTVAVKDYVNLNFTEPKLMEEYQGLLTYYLPDRSMRWSRMFGTMERAKRTLAVEDYSISQTTLEQIFLQFTKYQTQTTEL